MIQACVKGKWLEVNDLNHTATDAPKISFNVTLYGIYIFFVSLADHAID
jgi:hypothetical protein